MLPEHVKLLRGFDRDQDKVDKPILDENQLEEINLLICEAMEYNQAIVFTYFERGYYRTCISYAHYVDVIKQELRIIDFHNDEIKLKYEEIINAKFYT